MNQFESRKFVILFTFLTIAVIFVIRLLFIQAIDDKWQIEAQRISENKVTVHASRGLIYDRNGELLVANNPVYDLNTTPRKVKDIDTAAFCELVGITREEFLAKMEKASNYATYKESIFEALIPLDEYAQIDEQLYKYPGFTGDARTLRGYPHSIGAHVLGYTGEVNADHIKKDPYYRARDHIGVAGIEKYYEEQLRGSRGTRFILRDAFNREKGAFAEGKYDTAAITGENLFTSIDLDLQAYGEYLMQNKKGSIVAIEPATGEILALVTSPSYDPNELVGRSRGKNYVALLKNDSLKPLFNRATMAPYPPGSIFKLIQSLVALDEGVITANTGFACNKALVGCHNHVNCNSIQEAIQHSCNPYYYNAVKRIIEQGKESSKFKDAELGLANWKKHILSFGFGEKLDIDLPNLKGGYIPGPDYYDKIYGHNRWAYSTIYSISIGQGEVSTVPIQMANLAAIMANRGFYYTPHLVKKIGDDGQKLPKYLKKNYTTVAPEHFPPVIEGMRRVVYEPGGTARRARIDSSIVVCGKTGTAQNPHGEDHSVFISFAPMDSPKIAVAVFVENSGPGGAWAAPIASLMMEKYINGEVKQKKKEARILEANFIDPPQ